MQQQNLKKYKKYFPVFDALILPKLNFSFSQLFHYFEMYNVIFLVWDGIIIEGIFHDLLELIILAEKCCCFLSPI
jgi:hypothetical protein